MTLAPSARATLSRSLRRLLPAALALATATCTQDNVGPSSSGVGYFTFRPTYQLAGGASLAQFGIVADSVHIVITRPVAQLVLDTTVFFPPDSTELHLALPITLDQSPDTLDAVIEITSGGVVLFRDSIRTEVFDGPPSGSGIPQVLFEYVGPGTEIAELEITPGDTTIAFGDTLFFEAEAADSFEAEVTSFYVGWSTSDTSIARINANGRLIAPNLRSTVRVVGITPTGIADSTTITFAPVPVIITADSGDAQSAPTGDSLPELFVARVKGADSLGIAGIAVRFVAVDSAQGAAVRDFIVLTDSTGRARTRALLGIVATDYQFTATALGTGLPDRVFTATATAAVPTAIAIVSGNDQVDTVAQLLPQPLVVHVTDAFTNPVANVPVVFATIFGDGTVGDDTVLTNASGDASIGYTLGISTGTDSITATIAGTSAFALFNARGIADTPAQTQEFGGGNQTVAAGTPYPDSLVVRVFDTHDNPVPGAQVVWSIFAGTGTLGLDTTVTDSTGSAKNALTAGGVAGELQVEVRALPIVNGITITNHIIPAAPSAMTIGAGNGQSGNAGTPLAIAPTVHVVDSFGNVVPGASIDFVVTAGAGSVDSATATTDSAGDANAGVWTLGATAGLNQVRATSAAIPADTLLFDATALPSGTTKLWTAAVSNDWSLDDNWEPVGAPTTSDNLFIPAAFASPLISSPTVVQDLIVESGATLTLGAVTLNVSGSADIAGTVTGSGTLNLTGSGTSFEGNTGTALVLVNGTPHLSGPTSITGDLTINAGYVAVGGYSLGVSGNLTVQSSGQFVMTAFGDSVDIGGNVSYTTGTDGSGSLSIGVLVIRGNLTQVGGSSSNFAPSGSHTVRMAGASPQSVNFTNPGSASSRFQNFEVANSAGVTVTSNLSIMGDATVSAGALTGIGRTATLSGSLISSDAAWQVSTTQFAVGPAVYPDSLSRHVIVAADWTLSKPFKVDSSFNVTGAGVMRLGGHALVVDGAVASTGRIVMTNAADSLDVTGSFTTTSGVTSVGDLTNGVLVLRGNFTQVGGSSSNFNATGAHRTRFLGSTPQTVAFSNVGTSASRFMGVEFGNPAGTDLTTNMFIAGPASVTAGTVTGIGRTATLVGDLVSPYEGWEVSTTAWVGTPSVYPDSLPRNVTINAAVTLNKPFKVDSSVTTFSTGSVTLNGNAFRIGGAFIQSGLLVMQSAADTLDVTGLLTVNSGSPSTGGLTAGLVRVRGGFTQVGGSSSNFSTSGTHTTRFEATGGQTVSFSNPGATSSHFQILEVADSINVNTGLSVTGATTILPGGKVQSIQIATLAGPLSDPTNLGWRYQATILSGTVTSVPDSIVSNVTLQGSWALAQRTRITGIFAIGAGATLDLNGDTLLVSGAMTQGGTLASSDPNGMLGVSGLLTVNSGVSGVGALTEGHLVLQNGFTQVSGSSSNFAPTVNFLTTFAGVGGHTVAFTNPGTAGSRFHHLAVFDSLTVNTNIAATGNTTLDPAGRLVGVTRTGTLLGGLTDPSGLGWRMTNTIIPGGQIVPDSLVTNLTLTGAWTLPNRQWIDGSFAISSTGSLDLGAQRLDVSGAMTQTGELRMQQLQDTLAVAGLLTVNSGQAGTDDLVDGALLLHGGILQQSGASSNFAASSNHITWFIGSTGQPVDFTNAAFGSSHFHNVVVADSLDLGSNMAATGLVTVDSAARVIGAGRTATLGSGLIDSETGWAVGTTVFALPFPQLPQTLVSNVILQDSLFLPYTVNVTGDFTLQSNAYLGFGGHGLNVSGNFTQSGQVAMFATQDSLEVGGNFLVNSGLSGAGNLVAGVIVLHGGFEQQAGASANFVSSTPHRVRFTGAGGGNVGFTNPASSMFGDLEFDGTGAYTVTSTVQATGTLKVAGGPATLTSPATQRLVRAGALQVDGLVLDRVRMQLNSPGSNAAQFDNVTFTNQDPTLTQLSLEFPGQTGDTIKLNNVTFDGTPTTGRYVYAADSLANDGVANIAFYNSFPLNGSLFTGTEGSQGDTPNVLWSHLEWQTDLVDGVELLPILSAPEVVAVDPSGIPLSGYTGTVTLAFYTDPSAGAASLAGNVEAAVGGVATFDALTISLAGAGYQLQGSSPELSQTPPSSAFTISIPLPVGTTTAFNNGGGDNDWFNAANWTFGVPDSADNLYIYPGQSVTVNAPASANKVEVGSGAGIVLNAPLTVDSSVVAGNTISGGGQLVAQGSGELSGQVGDLLVTGAYTVPTGETLTSTGIVISGIGASLDPGQAQITSLDSLRTEAGGRLDMADPAAVVTVQGLARFTGGASALTAGTLQLSGDFSQEENVGAFVADTGFVTLFTGGGTLSATFLSPDSLSDHFGTLVVEGSTVLSINGMVTMLGDLQVNSGIVNLSGATFVGGDVDGGGTLEGAGPLQVVGDLAFAGTYTVANTWFMGPTHTISALAVPFDTVNVIGAAVLGGNVVANAFYVSGQFLMNGNRLDVIGDFGTFGTGSFAMNDPADSLMVGGGFYASGGPTTGLLTDGLLQVAGNFVQGTYVPCCVEIIVTGPMPAGSSFDADVGHTTRLVGGLGARIISFSNPLQPPGSGVPIGDESQFGTLELVDGVDSLVSVVPVIGTTTVLGGSLHDGTLAAAGPLVVGPGVAAMNVASLYTGAGIDYQAPSVTYNVNETFFFGGDSIPDLPYQWLRVGFTTMALTGNLTVGSVTLGDQGEGPGDSYNGDLDLNGHTLTVSGDFTTSGFGRLRMVAPADSLDVGGAMDLRGGDMTGMITDGDIVARGSVYLSPGWTDTSFVTAGNNHFVMDAAGFVDLWVSQSPGDPLSFANFAVAPGTTVNFNPFSTGALVVGDSLDIRGDFAQGSPGRKIVSYGAFYVGVALGVTVDTVELHNELEVSGAGYNVEVTRYAGTGQLITPAVTYQDIQVTGTVAMDSSVIVNRDVTVLGTGQLDLGSKELSVARTFRTQDDARLIMTDPSAVLAADTAVFGGASTAGYLTAGALQTRNLIQENGISDSSYHATGSHLTWIGTSLGGSEYLIQMATGDGRSQIAHLRLNDGGFGGVPTRIAGYVNVAGTMLTVSEGSGGVISSGGATLVVNDSLIVQDPATDFLLDTLELRGAISVPTNTFANIVTRFAGAGQLIPDTQGYQGVEVTGTVGLETTANVGSFRIRGSGVFTLTGFQQLIVSGDFATLDNGTLAMVDSGAPDLFIGGNATFGGGSSVGQLTVGNIRVVGDFTTVAGSSIEPFTSTNTGVRFQGSSTPQVVTLDPGTFGNFRAIGVTNPNGIVINGNMIVTDSVGTSGPIMGDTLGQFGNFFMNAGAQIGVKVLKTSGLFSGNPSVYAVGRTHLVVPNVVPNVVFDTLVINAAGTSTFFPVNANQLIVAGGGSPFSTGGLAAFELDQGGPNAVRSGITGNVVVEGNAYLRLGDDTVVAGGDFITRLGGRLEMSNTIGSLEVNGNAVFDGGSNSGFLNAGRLLIEGDLSQAASADPNSFAPSGMTLEFGTSGPHDIALAHPDQSYLPRLQGPGTSTLALNILGRARVAGDLSGYGLNLTGDSLWVDSQMTAGPAGGFVTLAELRVGELDQFGTFLSFEVGTGHLTGPMNLPFSANSMVFDSLFVHDSVQGQLGQTIATKYFEVTGPGNPRNLSGVPGRFYLIGNDGHTEVNVAGDVIVRGAGASIVNNDQGLLTATGGLMVESGGAIASLSSNFFNPRFEIAGSVLIDGASTAGLLTAGTLQIGGDFVQGANLSTQSYAPDPGHVTRFTGSGTHKVTFTTPSMAQSRFGTLAVDSGVAAPNVLDLQTWAFADTIAINGNGVQFRPEIIGNGNRFTIQGGFLFGTGITGTELVFNDQAGIAPSLGTIAFSGYSALAVPQLRLQTVGFGVASFSGLNFDDLAAGPWLAIDNTGALISVNIFSPDHVALPGNFVSTGLVTPSFSP